MKPLLILLIVSFSLLTACSEQVVTPSNSNSCPKYVELNYSNYDSLKTDPVQVQSVDFDGDCLVLTLQYSGGCQEHEVDLALILPDCGTPPLPPPTFEIRHNANDDSCEAWLTKVYSFDLSGIREEGKNQIDFVLNVKNAAGEWTSTTYTYNY